MDSDPRKVPLIPRLLLYIHWNLPTEPKKILSPEVPVVGQGSIQTTSRDGFETGSRGKLFLSAKYKAGMVSEWDQGLGWARISNKSQ